MGIKDVYNAATVQWTVLIQKYPKLYFLLLILCIITITVFVSRELTKAGKLGFQNASRFGYYYEVGDGGLSIDKPNRQLANKALQTQLSKYGYEISLEQLNQVPAVIVLSYLELEEDDVDPIALVAKIVIMSDPTYKTVAKSVDKAIRNNSAFADNYERSAVYDLLTKYFIAIKQPLGIPLANWSDYILIQTFKSLKAPTIAELSASPPSKRVASYDSNSSFAAASTIRTKAVDAMDAMTVTPSPLFSSVGSV